MNIKKISALIMLLTSPLLVSCGSKSNPPNKKHSTISKKNKNQGRGLFGKNRR